MMPPTHTHTHTHTPRTIVLCFSGEDFDPGQGHSEYLFTPPPGKEQRVLTSTYFLSVHRKNTLLGPYFIMKMRSRD